MRTNKSRSSSAAGDIIVGPCGNNEEMPECIGIAEAPITGQSEELLSEEIDAGHPVITLNFHTKEPLDSFIEALKNYRTNKFRN